MMTKEIEGSFREDSYPCDSCKHDPEPWDSEACDGCCKAHSGYEPEDSSTDSSTDKVYVVTQDGYLHNYGSEIYLVGVFTDKKEAEKAAYAGIVNITEIQLDKAFPLVKSKWGGVGNDYYLGGYIE